MATKSAKRLPPAAGKGRPKGSKNKTTTLLKEAILRAGEAVGQDGKGKGGLTGYLKRVAQEDVKAYSTLLGKVLPMQVAGDPDNPLKSLHKIELVAPGHDDSED